MMVKTAAARHWCAQLPVIQVTDSNGGKQRPTGIHQSMSGVIASVLRPLSLSPLQIVGVERLFGPLAFKRFTRVGCSVAKVL